MAGRRTKPVVVFLGNPLMGDDSIGLRIGRMIGDKLRREGIEVVVTSETGLSLADYMEGRETVVMVDAVSTGTMSPGTLKVFKLAEAGGNLLSPHYAGLPEVLGVMRVLNLSPPPNAFLIGVEVSDPYIISEKLSPELEEKLVFIAEETYRLILSLMQGSKPQ